MSPQIMWSVNSTLIQGPLNELLLLRHEQINANLNLQLKTI